MTTQETIIVYEARWPKLNQVFWSWRAYGDNYDKAKIAELESRGLVVTNFEMKR